MMPWDADSNQFAESESTLVDFLLRVVDSEDSPPSPPSAGVYTKCSKAFVNPAPLAPDDLGTPAKDPLESFNSWVRTQTPSVAPSPLANGHGFSPNCSGGIGYGSSRTIPFTLSPQKLFCADFMVNPAPHELRTSVEQRGPAPIRTTEAYVLDVERSASQGCDVINEIDWGAGPSASLSSPFPPSHPHGVAGSVSTAMGIRGKVYETAKDQHGCRFLQRLLDAHQDTEVTQVVVREIVPHVAELMTDQYANFLVQKLLDIVPRDTRYSIAQVAAPHLTVVALTPHGTFSVQKLIETIATREEMAVVRDALSRDVVRLVKDVHGNHVIQKVLQRFSHVDKEFVYDAIFADIVGIATNKQGCCVLQRCMEFASPHQHSQLVSHILEYCLQIVQDPFGNYVLQYVLEAKDSAINDAIALAFLPHLVQLCTNKFSSNVMEKVLRGATQPVKTVYVDKMLMPGVASALVQDDYGNYVLQTALTMSSPAQAEALVAAIRPLLPTIRNAPYAKKLESKIDSICKKKVPPSPGKAGGGGSSGTSHRAHRGCGGSHGHGGHHGGPHSTPRSPEVHCGSRGGGANNSHTPWGKH